MGGCATGQGPIVENLPTSNAKDTAKVFIKRDKAFFGCAQTYTLTINKKEIYKLKNGDQFSLDLDPGEYFFGVNSHGGWQMVGNYTEIFVQLEKNREYYIRVRPTGNGAAIERSSGF